MKPGMRKAPQQDRSRMLVTSVKEACRRILFGEVDAPFNTTSLANLSGVAVGSLYQYFDGIEAVVASVYDDLAYAQVSSQRDFAVNQLAEMPLRQGLSYIIAASTSFHRQMLELNPDFHRQYHECFNLNECFNRMSEADQGTVWVVATLIKRELSGLDGLDIPLTASLIIEAIRTTINTVVRQSPAALFDSTFEQRLLNMSLGLLDPS